MGYKTEKLILTIDSGWIVCGDCSKQKSILGDVIRVENAHVIRYFKCEKNGLGGVATGSPTELKLDHYGITEVRIDKVIKSIQIRKESDLWKELKS